eukprot:g9669.t1
MRRKFALQVLVMVAAGVVWAPGRASCLLCAPALVFVPVPPKPCPCYMTTSTCRSRITERLQPPWEHCGMTLIHFTIRYGKWETGRPIKALLFDAYSRILLPQSNFIIQAVALLSVTSLVPSRGPCVNSWLCSVS